MAFFRYSIPNVLANRCIEQYEKQELRLELSTEYQKIKKETLKRNRVSVKDLEKFVALTRYYPYSRFTELKNCPKKNSENKIQYDIKFNSCLYISFCNFTKEQCNELRKILHRYKCKYIIFDLRNNAGGDVEACVEMCNMFMRDCEIVCLQYKEKSVAYHADEQYISFNRIYILVGRNTMSSGEIFTLSMFSNLENVIVLGSETFQKDVGQINYMNHKYHYMLTITAYLWSVNHLSICDFQKNIIPISWDDLDDYLKYVYNSIM